METEEIRKIYRKTELLTTLVLLVSLPAFALVYLYYNSGNLDWDLPSLPDFVNGFILGGGVAMLVGQYVLFHKQLKPALGDLSLLEKVKIYTQATLKRFLILFGASILATIGLLLNQDPSHIVIFALCLVFFSLGKPSPDRIARLLRLKKEDREILREASRPEGV